MQNVKQMGLCKKYFENPSVLILHSNVDEKLISHSKRGLEIQLYLRVL